MPDLNTMQMLAMMGPGALQSYAGMDMYPKMAGLPQPNPSRIMDSYMQRRAIREGLYGPGTHPTGGRGFFGHRAAWDQGMPPLGGGLDPSSITDPSVANQTLAPYGLQLPTHTNPFLFFKDQNADGSPTWAGNHPKVARAIEGAMVGATTQGGSTIGENISNVAKTVLGLPGLYKQNQAAQMEAPFQQAGQIASLQEKGIDMQTKLAQAFHLMATGQAALDKPPKPPHYQLYVDPKGKAFGYNQDTNSFETPSGQTVDTPEKVGTFGKQAGKYPAGVKSQSERMGYDAYIAAGGESNPDGSPKDVGRYQKYVYASQANSAAATGAAGTKARKAAGQGEGDVSEADKARLRALEDDAKQKEAKAREKISASQFANEADPLAARNAEMARRNQEAKAARDAYNRAAGQVQTNQPNSKIQGSGRPKTTIHPDGRIEIQ